MENQEFIRYRNPVEYLKVIFRRKWFFIIPSFIGLVLGIIACFLLPKSFESYTVILVQEEKLLNPLIQGLAVSTSVNQRMATIKEQLLGWHSLVELTKKLNLAQNISNQADFEDLILKLRGNISVKMYGPMLIRISYQSRDPRECQLVVQTLSDILIEENMREQAKDSDIAINFIKEQLQVYKRKIKESEINAMEEQLKNLLHDSTEEHPMVKELRDKVNRAKKELESGEYKVESPEKPIPSPVYESMKKELDKIIQDETAKAVPLNTAYAQSENKEGDPNATIYKLLLMDKIDSSVSRDMNVNENIYNMLLQKLETAKITQRLEASKEGTRYNIIDPPRLPLKPSKPKKIMVVLMGFFLGGFAGTGLVFGREFMDQSFLDIEDAKNNLGYPVLGAISRITTPEEVQKEKIRHRMAMITLTVTSVLLIIIAMLVSLLKK